jgi:hypothetical protein
MVRYSCIERAFILECYFKSKSYKKTQQTFSQRFPMASVPHKTTIKRLVSKFQSGRGVANIVRDPRQPKSLTEEKMAEVQGLVIDNHRLSLRRIGQQADLPHTTVHLALRKHLELHPYKVTVVHELLPADRDARLLFCEWLNEVVTHDPNFLSKVFFTDEAWFHLDGYVNSQNCRIWSTTNPHAIHEHPLYPIKVGVWAAMTSQRIFITFFDTTVTSAVYCGFLDQLAATFSEEEIYSGWFQQDGAPAHTSRMSMNHLSLYFGERVISKGLWPPRSPDLSPPDFFLWGYLKSKVYENNPRTLNDLKENIKIEVNNISPPLLNKVCHSLENRTNMCIFSNGMHFQQL